MKKTTVLSVVLTLLWCSVAVAGVVVDVEQRQISGADAEVMKGRLLLDGDRLKMVANEDDSSEPSLIYQGDEQRLLIVDHSRQSWMQIDAEMMHQLVGQMEGMMEQMEQALAQLPPEQRKAAEEMMQQRMPAAMSGGGVKAKFEVSKTDRQEKHEGKLCRAYEVHLGGDLKSIIWATDWKNVSVAKDDFKAFRDMAAFLGELVQSIPMMAEDGGPDMFPGLDKIEGFPVVIQEYEDGELASETFFRNPRQQKFDAKEFEAPAGYTAETLQDQMRGNAGY